MKKAFIALAIIMAFTTASFASVSFLVAPGVGEGKIAVLGLYGTNHIAGEQASATKGNSDGQPADQFDVTSLGVRGAYGLMDNLDLLAAYTVDTLPNIKAIDSPNDSGKQKSGNTTSLGVKYTVLKESKDNPVDVAVVVGFEQSMATVQTDGTVFVKELGIGTTSYVLGGIVSKKIDNMVPYGGLSYKSLTKHENQVFDSTGGTAIALNLGIMYGIAPGTAIALEYNSESQAWAEGSVKKGYYMPGEKALDAVNNVVSGLSLGVCYVF